MKEFKKYASFISLGLVVVALIMLFVEPSIIYKVMNTSTKMDVSAFNVMFGIEDGFDFNILGTITAVLLLAGLILPFFVFDDKLKHLIAATVLIVGGILLFVFPTTIEIAVGSFSAGWPLIVAGILGILAGVVNLVKAVA